MVTMTTVPLGEAKDKLSALVDSAQSTHDIITITKHGKPAAVLMSAGWISKNRCTKRYYWLSRANTMEAVAQAEAEYAAGETVSLDRLRAAYDLPAAMSDEGPPPYDVEIAAPSRRALSRLSGRVVQAIIEFIGGPLAQNPHRLSKPLRDQLEGVRSARRGDYRILLRIDEENHTILVIDIEHRAHLYRT